MPKRLATTQHLTITMQGAVAAKHKGLWTPERLRAMQCGFLLPLPMDGKPGLGMNDSNEEKRISDPLNLRELQESLKSLEPLRQTYRHVLSQLRPWCEFRSIEKPQGDTQKRLRANLEYFRANYALITLIIMMVTTLSSPVCLLVVAGLAITLARILGSLSNYEEKSQVQHLLPEITFSVFSCLVLCLLAGRLFLLAVVLPCTLFIFGHAVLHPVPVAIEALGEVTDMI